MSIVELKRNPNHATHYAEPLNEEPRRVSIHKHYLNIGTVNNSKAKPISESATYALEPSTNA